MTHPTVTRPAPGPQRAETFRERIAGAVWNDLIRSGGLVRNGDGNGSTFRWAGRPYTLRHPVSATGRLARSWVVAPVGDTGVPPFASGLAWTGGTRRAAVMAMVRYAHGRPCPHGTNTGQDTCANCDAYDAYERDS
ncbi:hypothetical protein [Streptomyces sp. NPDC002611]